MVHHVARRAGAILTVAWGIGGLGGCSQTRPAAAGRPFILVSIDTLRSDHLPTYGYKELRTPAFDALAGDSIVFERAFSHYPLTLPSHASVFTGLLPPGH